MLLSILIPTLHERRGSFEAMEQELRRQIDEGGFGEVVEVLSRADGGEESLGAKRNALVAEARGEFVCFVDDDDTVSERYVSTIVGALRDDPAVDCVGMEGTITFRGEHPRTFRHSLRYDRYSSSGGVYCRPPYHLNPIRRTIALRYPFAEVDVSEDVDWALRLAAAGALGRETFVSGPLYHYRCRRPWAYQWLLDRTEWLRHPLGLTMVNRLRWTRPRRPAGAGAPSEPVTVIEPFDGRARLGLHELWQHRRLLPLLVWRDVKARYKQTLAGATWVVVQPLLTMVVFTLFFGRWLQLPSSEPYPVFAYCGLVPWTYFVHALTVSSNSIANQQQLVTKVHFPRLILPLSSVVGGLVDLLVALLVLVPLMAVYGVAPDARLLALPLFVLFAAVSALAFGAGLAALNVRFRDVGQAMPFVSQLWLFLTPVAYSADVIDERWRALLYLNPMAGVVEGFRWSLSAQETLSSSGLLTSLAATALILAVSVTYFRREEVTFADVV